MDFVDVLDDMSATADIDIGESDRLKAPRNFRQRTDPFTYFSDSDFKLRYRFAKETVQVLIDLLDDKLRRETNRNQPLSTATQVLVTLRYAASGSFLREDADFHGISLSSVSRCIHDVFETIASMKPSFISFPTPDELSKIERGFYQMKGFPGVVGAVDGTHIYMQRPTTDDCERYRNRKGRFSINTQLMCDDRLMIRNVVASWPGSAHDSRIFNESTLKTQLETLPPQYHLLGDSGYACTPSLLIPFPGGPDDSDPCERRYNKAHSSTRMSIERLNGILKRRFACMGKELAFSPEKCSVIIVACCVLHNLAMMENDHWDGDPNLQDEEEDRGVAPTSTNAGSAKRTAIMREYFS